MTRYMCCFSLIIIVSLQTLNKIYQCDIQYKRLFDQSPPIKDNLRIVDRSRCSKVSIIRRQTLWLCVNIMHNNEIKQALAVLVIPGASSNMFCVVLLPPNDVTWMAYTVYWVMLPLGLAGGLQLTSTTRGMTSLAQTDLGSEGPAR